MAGSSKKNAIERRLDQISTHWNQFASDKERRALRWLVDDDERRVVETWLAFQDEPGSDVPDLLLRFEEPFADAQRHGFALAESLRRQYDEIRAGLREEQIAADWQAPSTRPGEHDFEYFGRCCGAFQGYYGGMMERFVVVLVPRSINNAAAWTAWLRAFIEGGTSETVRLLLVDEVEHALLDDLAKAQPQRLSTVRLELDMPAAYLELARGDGKGGAGTSFRLNFVALTQAAAKGDFAKARQHAASALAIAQEHGWAQMEVAVHMALAATQLGAKQPNEAITAYRAAGTIAAAAAEKGDPAAAKLILQGKLGEGAALLSDARHGEAAKIYEEAATIAQKNEDHLMTLESWRMAAYCHEQCKQIEPSLRCGDLALDAAERLDPEIRANSTLPYVGQGLLRLVQPRGRVFRTVTRDDQARAIQVHARMVRLAGPDWEKKLKPQKAV